MIPKAVAGAATGSHVSPQTGGWVRDVLARNPRRRKGTGSEAAAAAAETFPEPTANVAAVCAVRFPTARA